VEEILTDVLQFFRHRSWFEAFLYILIGHGGGVALKGWYLHMTVPIGGPFDSIVAYLDITIAVCVTFESILPAHYSCCWRSPWKQGIYTFKLLLKAPLKARHLHITTAGGDPFESEVVAHYSCCWGPFEIKVLKHCNCCWEPLWK